MKGSYKKSEVNPLPFTTRRKYKNVLHPTKQRVIENGLTYLDGVGAELICSVCIPNGGSCCLGCSHLKQGAGCQQRNTSCTAWLCGFLKYIYYEAGLLSEWEHFWNQVPGQSYRTDFTPAYFEIKDWLDIPNIRFLSAAFAEDLQELLATEQDPSWIIEIKDSLDYYVDKITSYQDPEIRKYVEKKLKLITKDFKRFHSAKEKLSTYSAGS